MLRFQSKMRSFPGGIILGTLPFYGGEMILVIQLMDS